MDLQRTDRQFRDRAADLIRSDAHDFDHNLSVFVHFICTDPTLAELAEPLLSRDIDVDEWVQKILKSRSLELPIDEDDRLALLLQLLKAIDDGTVDVLHIANAISWERKYDDLIRSFNEKFTRLAVRGLGERLRALSPPQQISAGAPVIHTGAGSTSMIAIGSNIAQTVGVAGSDVAELLTAFREAIAVDQALGANAKAELGDDIDILEREARRTTPRSEIVVAVLESLAAVPGLVDLVQRAAEFFRVTLG